MVGVYINFSSFKILMKINLFLLYRGFLKVLKTFQHKSNMSLRERDQVIDTGLRSYMLSVYNYMASGLTLTGAVAMLIASSPTLIQVFFGTGLHWIIMFLPIILVLFLSVRLHKMSVESVKIIFWSYSILMGISLSSVFLLYTGESIARTFFITAATFISMSLYGYTTKKNLLSWSSFLFMGIIGICLCSIINIFIGSTALQFVISGAGVLIFTGLTAYDTQNIKHAYCLHDNTMESSKKAIFGALQLYLDFINIFIMMIQFFNINRD